MKTKYWLTILFTLALLGSVTISLAASVTPIQFPNLQIGDAAHYCVTTLGYDWGMKIEDWGGPGGSDDPADLNGPFSGAYDSMGMLHEDYENVVTLSNATRLKFDFASDPYAIYAVVVQGGSMDNIFFYAHPVYAPEGEPVTSDTYLFPYDNLATRKVEDISHISFCWNQTTDDGDDDDDDPDPVCYGEETAWAYGLPYIGASQWAMYVPYYGEELTVDIYAGQNMLAGTATFSAPDEDGMVTITINLVDGWIFYYDLGDEEADENLKVQDYEVPPEGNPAIGLFDWKISVPVGSSTAAIEVPLNNFYGVHLDVANVIDCEVEEP